MIYFEDLEVGVVRELGSKTITKEEILAFAKDYDPQPFHTDEAAAERSIFGGLIASGWHTASIMMRLIVDGAVERAAVLPSPGFDDLRWLKPVRPGDTLTVRGGCIEKTPSRSKPWLGSARIRTEMLNQDGDVVMSVNNIAIYRRRDTAEPGDEKDDG